MAELSIHSLITSKNDELDGGSVIKNASGVQNSLTNEHSTDTHPRRTSVGPNHAGGSSLRRSAEKSESSDSSHVVPHYLRASTGSCHDFCKFGRERSVETKTRKPFRKKIGKLSPYELSPIQILVSGGEKKEEVVSGGKKKGEVVSGGKGKEVISVGKEKEEVISVGKEEEVVSGGKKKEVEVSGGKKKGEEVSGGKKEEVISFGKKKEEVISVGKKEEVMSAGNQEVVVSGGKKEEEASSGKAKEEVVSGGKKKGDIVSVGQKGENVISGSLKKEEAVSTGQKKGEVVSADQKKEEVVSIGEKKEEDHGTPTETKDHSAHKKPSPDTKSRPANTTSVDKVKASTHKSSAYTNNHSPNVTSSQNKPSLLRHKTNSSKQNDSSGNKTLSLKCKPSSTKKSPSADPPEIVKSVVFTYTEVSNSMKQDSSSDNKISGTVKKTATVPKQHSIPVKLKPVKIKPSSSSDDSDGKDGKGRRNSNSETGGKLMASKASAKKIFAPPTLTSKLSLNKTAEIKSRKPGSLKTVSSLKDKSGTRRVSSDKASNSKKVSEKTLHAIRMETGKDLSDCISGDNVISSSTPSPSSAKPSTHGKSSSLSFHEQDISESESDVEADEVIPESNGSLETSKEAAVKEIDNKTLKKIRVVVPEDKHISPVKVKFRMGKVVDLQCDNNTPRKLRFRSARVLGADSKGDIRKKTSKRAGVNADTAATEDSSEKVILKHQNVQGKKDAQGLLNNVIEETASKLAVSRKSKVKALVGAFETVISLQEIKASTQVVS